MSHGGAKTPAKPTKFDKGEYYLLQLLARKKGVTDAEIVRRSVRLLLQEIERRGPSWDWLEETSEPMDLSALTKARTRIESTQMLKQLVEEADDHRRARGSSNSRRAS